MGARAVGPEPLDPGLFRPGLFDPEPAEPGTIDRELVGPGLVGPTEDRSGLLADLAARIATVGRTAGAGRATDAAGATGLAGAYGPSGARSRPPRRGRDPDEAVPESATQPTKPSPAQPAGLPAPRRGRAIGGQPREVPPAGGHPEDAPGDPAAVARQICLRQLTMAPRTRSQLAEALRRREIPDDVAEQVLERLADVRLIDDAAYAEAFVATRHRDRGLGRTALRAELQRKGVAPELAAEAVTAIDSEAERARAAALIARRIDAAMAAGPEAARRRLVGLLARRGYGPGVAVPVVDEALRRYADEG